MWTLFVFSFYISRHVRSSLPALFPQKLRKLLSTFQGEKHSVGSPCRGRRTGKPSERLSDGDKSPARPAWLYFIPLSAGGD